jgi:hypothetical protein
MNENILIALLHSSSLILAALITGYGVVKGAEKIAERKRLQAQLLEALKDIQTLYTIEQYHDEINLHVKGVSNKTHVRKLVLKNENLILSGKHTLSQVQRKINYWELVKD